MALYAGEIIRAADLTPTDWQPVVFRSPWRNYGSGWSDAQFRYHPLTNSVEVKGTINGNDENGDNNVPAESTAFVLPEGYRPISNLATFAGHVSSPVSSNIEVRFLSSGSVNIIGANALTNAVVVIDGVMFYVGE